MNPEKLWRGDYSLPMTYWVYGWLVSLAWAVPMSFMTPGSLLAIITMIFWVAWLVVWSMGVWHAAGKYEGAATWAYLAKAHAVAPFVTLCVLLIAFGASKLS